MEEKYRVVEDQAAASVEALAALVVAPGSEMVEVSKPKQLWHKLVGGMKSQRSKLVPAANFVQQTIMSGASMRENSNVFDWANLALNIKKHYHNTIGHRSVLSFFKDFQIISDFPDWSNYWIGFFAMQGADRVVEELKDERYSIYSFELSEIKFYWWTEEGQHHSLIHVCPETDLEAAQKVLKEYFWSVFSGGQAICRLEENKLIIEKKINEKFVPFQRCQDEADEIKKYLQAGYSRSVLFYGPPGSGKTNLVEGIARQLGKQCLYFENLGSFYHNFIAEILKFLQPSSVVLEDLDSLGESDLKNILKKLEEFNQKNLVLLATSNQVNLLSNNVVRPGRFDITKEIKFLDFEIVLALVDGDREVAEMVKEFPVSFIVETLKRVKVLGKETALNSLDDLKIRVQNFSAENYDLSKENQTSSRVKDVFATIAKIGRTTGEGPVEADMSNMAFPPLVDEDE